MTKDEALSLALEALEGVLDDSPKVLDASISGGLYEVVQCRDAITAIKAALEAKDQPVFWERRPDGKIGPTNSPQRTWVGLTDEEIEVIEVLRAPPVHPDFVDCDDWVEFARAIEAKLKEKNT